MKFLQIEDELWDSTEEAYRNLQRQAFLVEQAIYGVEAILKKFCRFHCILENALYGASSVHISLKMKLELMLK